MTLSSWSLRYVLVEDLGRKYDARAVVEVMLMLTYGL